MKNSLRKITNALAGIGIGLSALSGSAQESITEKPDFLEYCSQFSAREALLTTKNSVIAENIYILGTLRSPFNLDIEETFKGTNFVGEDGFVLRDRENLRWIIPLSKFREMYDNGTHTVDMYFAEPSHPCYKIVTPGA